ncbi:diaminopimelate decarboxylase [uncultured Dubosiella sp.]|uniref:diaminopimelate decarboxylase n=1 Tax=uncultured Dubosiella sp. TaxID=1937011 RepID=UPI00272FB88B|nr:diaminopimelate decarboxylase [uncultured Dubosiella sp.]
MEEIKNNALYIGGVRAQDLADQYGTPLYVYDQGVLENKLEQFIRSFRSDRFKTTIVYASKAFLCIAMARLADRYGIDLDVVSGEELYVARQAGFPMERIVFHGNNKTLDELKAALEYGVGTIIVDNAQEARRLASLPVSKPTTVLLRVNPGVEAHTHEYIVTAHVDSKFGVLKDETDAIAAIIDCVEANPNLRFQGFHAHIGSQIFDRNAFKAEIETMGRFLAGMKQKTGRVFPVLDLGGGFAATYTSEDAPIPVKEVGPFILEQCAAIDDEYDLGLERILIEPGRSIVAEAGYTLYRAGYTKTTPHKRYVFVDGGMSDNIRPALYQAKYRAEAAEKMNEEKTETYCIAGKCCESGDIVIENAALPPIETDDILVVYTTGAYGYSMASNYNLLRIPAVVFVKDGRSSLVVRRQTLEDLVARDAGDAL